MWLHLSQNLVLSHKPVFFTVMDPSFRTKCDLNDRSADIIADFIEIPNSLNEGACLNQVGWMDNDGKLCCKANDWVT